MLRGVPASIRARRRAAPFDPRFIERHPLLWPLARAAEPFRDARDWPPVAAWTAAFGAAPSSAATQSPPVRFAEAAPRPRRRREPVAVERRYDGRIVHRGEVPSRAQCWHDFLNALVCAPFPPPKPPPH